MGSCLLVAPVAGLAQEQSASPRPSIPRVEATGGIRFQSQGGGTANTVSGYLFAPLSQSASGGLSFLDFSANLNLGGVAPQVNTVNAGVSTRLGYRWLNQPQTWIYGVNAGVDTRPAYSSYAFQAGVGAEALSRSLEFRLNSYIPFANTNELYATGWTNAALTGDRLILDGYNQYVVAVGGVDFEAGVPLKTWKNGSLWAYAAYYYLDGDYLAGSSGIRGRAEVRVGSQLAVGATVSYDNLFYTQATGYIRYGAKPLAGNAKDAVAQAERNFLALRGLPVVRETDVKLDTAQVNAPNTVAINPATGQAYVVRCAGSTTSAYQVNCGYATGLDAINAGPSNAVLIANGTPVNNLNGQTIRLAAGTSLTNSSNAPTLNTQFGPASLLSIFGTSTGAAPSFNNGVISIGSNTTIAGLNFTNTSITNYSTSNVLIANNQFTGSFTTNPTPLATAQAFGAINVSADALPAIQLDGVQNLTITNNSFLYPQVQTYKSQNGKLDGGGEAPVCNQNGVNTSGLCLSGNAIRLNNSTNTVIANNSVEGALDEAFRINNPSGSLVIDGNNITNMRMGPDSNIGTAIIVGQNQGISAIIISNNSFSNNSPGVYPIVTDANQTGVAVATGPITAGGITYKPVNNIDPIEIGLCRGTTNYPRQQDLYADPNFSGNCNSPTKMTVTVNDNVISLPFISRTIKQDGDGIDFNIGSNAILKTNVVNNSVLTLGGTGDNGITFDIRGNAQAKISITNNSINDISDEAIDLGFTNTTANNQPGLTEAFLSDNTFTNNNNSGLLNIGLINNPGTPVSSFYVTGLGNNASQVSNTAPKYQGFNTGSFPDLYLNGSLYPKP